MDITPPNTQALFNTFDLSYQQGYDSSQPLFWDKVATQRPSATRQQTYAWMARLPSLREWVGERVVNAVSSYGYAIVNKDYELTEELDRNDILDDTYGLFNPIAEEMGRAARKWPDIQLAKLMQAGESTLCFDGQNFFDPTHPVDKYDPTLGVQSNLYKLPLNPDSYATVRADMMAWLGEDKQPLGVTPKLLVVPPQLEQMARVILHADFFAPEFYAGGGKQVGSNQNILKGTADLLVIPELAGKPKDWYLLDTTRAVKPFIFQLRQAPQFVQFNDPKSEAVFRRKKFVYGVDARGNVGLSLWFLAAKSVVGP